jgi:hypothetical protein
MEHTRFVGLDIHKERISITVAESGRSVAVEYLGEIANDPGAVSKLCERLGRSGKPLAFCYEAGPCGYFIANLQSLATWTKTANKLIASHRRAEKPSTTKPADVHE